LSEEEIGRIMRTVFNVLEDPKGAEHAEVAERPALRFPAFTSTCPARKSMTEAEVDPIRARLEKYVGKPMGPPATAPDPVNVPMIRHWVDALDDRNPVYLDAAVAAKTRFGGLVAPPAMLQTWSMPRPVIQGIAERGGAPSDTPSDNVVRALDEAGYVGTLATNSELEFVRYLRPGDLLHTATELESISPRKTTALGQGYFVTWVTTYRADDDELVGRQLFRIFKFDPSTIDPSKLPGTR